MDLAKKYVKSVARRFQKLPVYYPGRVVRVGDILSYGKNSLGLPKNPFGEPVGVFGNLVNDPKFGNSIETEFGASDQNYHFVSENEVDVTIGGSASAPDLITGEFKFYFKKEGSTMIVANGTNSIRMANQSQLKSVIQQNLTVENWVEFYIVTEVETAKKLLVFQSATNSGELVISANVDEIQIGGSNISGIDAGVDFKVKKYINSSFIIPWAEDKTLFMKLVRVRRNGDIVSGTKSFKVPDLGAKQTKTPDLELEEYSVLNWF